MHFWSAFSSCLVQLSMEQAWPELPSAVFVPLVGLLDPMEIKSSRSVCKNWRQDVDAALTSLIPRSMIDAEVDHLHGSSQHNAAIKVSKPYDLSVRPALHCHIGPCSYLLCIDFEAHTQCSSHAKLAESLQAESTISSCWTCRIARCYTACCLWKCWTARAWWGHRTHTWRSLPASRGWSI